jgi:hypothetical protein
MFYFNIMPMLTIIQARVASLSARVTSPSVLAVTRSFASNELIFSHMSQVTYGSGVSLFDVYACSSRHSLDYGIAESGRARKFD